MAPPSAALPRDSPADTNSIASSLTPDRDSATSRLPAISLQPANIKQQQTKSHKLFRKFRSVFRSFPIITPSSCKFPVSLAGGHQGTDKYIHGGIRVTGTLFGHRKARINLAFQENPKCLPFLLLELAIPTSKLIQDMGTGLMRIALECEKRPNEKTKIIDEPIWTLFCNGKKNGYGVNREPSEDDLSVMQLLHAVSTGVGVLPAEMADPQDGDLSYMRANFERVIGSKDSETYYMMMPDGNHGPELSVFFVRI
ncbi:protein MIZU-KUSSEI 1-like [Neltuma alba]|uniref:protein MIZU-KUSSEI 1-like n=1 Tax=Neltuma alba TaxID=207710 RepID=UPI0010A3F0E4|nr:protein MIZU-KUSSEI 1-like [Prosopis alba]